MPRTQPGVDSITRDEAIARLRQALTRFTDEETCMCKAAGDRGMFCNGFRRFTDGELRDRYWWIVRKRPNVTRAELEALANDWQLAQQDVQNLPTACDVQTKLHDTCRGWHDFTNEEIAQFYYDVAGERVRIG
jgi:hypothetical protein